MRAHIVTLTDLKTAVHMKSVYASSTQEQTQNFKLVLHGDAAFVPKIDCLSSVCLNVILTDHVFYLLYLIFRVLCACAYLQLVPDFKLS